MRVKKSLEFFVKSFINCKNNENNYQITDIRKKSFDFIANNDKRENTVKYTVYLYPNNKLYIRRCCKCGMFHRPQYYKLFRNSLTDNWQSFTSSELLIKRFNDYITKINKL